MLQFCLKELLFWSKTLFFNIPARRNFLKSDTVEMRHIFDEFQRIALAHPTIYFTLNSQRKRSFQFTIEQLPSKNS
jgi:DNA mismatch repair ATPase MutL